MAQTTVQKHRRHSLPALPPDRLTDRFLRCLTRLHPYRLSAVEIAPKARSIPAWGNAPCAETHNGTGLKARSILYAACAAALVLSFVPTACSAQTPHPLHIRIFNAKTNQPITDERLNVALKVDQIGSVAMATDKNGVILVDAGDATIIRILANMYADCRPRAELYTNYSIDTIRHSGITTGNLCGSSQHKARPGELILYEIPKTYIPTYPAPPASSLPHSDENPHVPKPQ
jgi:hypothetical protein